MISYIEELRFPSGAFEAERCKVCKRRAASFESRGGTPFPHASDCPAFRQELLEGLAHELVTELHAFVSREYVRVPHDVLRWSEAVRQLLMEQEVPEAEIRTLAERRKMYLSRLHYGKNK